jgi:hypothetical protein
LNLAVQDLVDDLDDILFGDEVAALMAVRHAWAMTAEQADAPGGAILIESRQDHARHQALVPFAEAVDVEELEARHQGGSDTPRCLTEGPKVKGMLGSSVRVEQLQKSGSRVSSSS